MSAAVGLPPGSAGPASSGGSASAAGPASSGGTSRIRRPVLAGLGWVPLVLAVLAEAAWITVVAGLAQVFALRGPVLGIGAMVLFVSLGTVATRVVAARTGGRWPFVALVLVAGGALAGWLASPDARMHVVAGDLGAAFAANPGGFAGGLAVLRGIAHGGEHLSAGTVGRMLFAGIPGIGFMAAAGGMIIEPWRGLFLADTAVATGVFAAAGLLAYAFAGVAEIERTGAPTWRRNPVWIALLVIAVVALVALAVPIALVGADAITTAIGLLVGISIVPLAIAGLLYGSGAGFRRVLGFIAVATVLVVLLSFAGFGNPVDPPDPGSGGGEVDEVTDIDRIAMAGTGVLVVALIAGVVVLLVSAWMIRQAAEANGPAGDVRSTELPEGEPRRARPRHRRHQPRGEPGSATEAYLRLVDELAGRWTVERRAAETPNEHARRLREDGESGTDALALELLAADYGLATFGGRAISEREHRRAIERWRRLRARLGADLPDRPRPPAPGSPAAEAIAAHLAASRQRSRAD